MGGCFSKPGSEQAAPKAQPALRSEQGAAHVDKQQESQIAEGKVSPSDSSETATTTSDETLQQAPRGSSKQMHPANGEVNTHVRAFDQDNATQSVPTPPQAAPLRAATSSRIAPSPFANLPPVRPPAAAQQADVGPEECGWSSPLSQTEWTEGSYNPPVLSDVSQERIRVHALKRLGINYMSKEPSLDFITRLITSVCNVTSAFICLIDGSRCYMKSTEGGPPGRSDFDRRLSISMHVLVPLKPEVLVVEDLAADARFKDHPFVKGRPHLRFFAGAPLLDASGQRIGCLEIQDFKPRKFDAESCNVLCNFAEMTMRELQRISESGIQRAMSWSPAPGNEQLLRTIDACSDGVVLIDVKVSRWPILFSNQGWSDVTGLPAVSGSLKNFWDLFQIPGVSYSRNPWVIYEPSVERKEIFTLDVILAGSSGKQLFSVSFKPATEDLDDGMVSINVPSRVPSSSAHQQDRPYYFGTISRQRTSSLSRSPSGRVAPLQEMVLPTEGDELKPPIPNVKLGPLLGKGSFGSVHYGTWNGAQIAVKVIQHMATEAERQARDEQLEAILGLKMLHPNIVRTFQFATKDRSGGRSSGMTERMRMNLNSLAEEEEAAPTSGQRKMMETWILLELCNRGSLQEAIDKGAFRIKAGEPNEGTANMINILRTATEIAGAMTYLHSLDILHSDLNGNNILLISNTGIDDRPFSVKVSDFGLSRIHIGERTVATQTYGTVTHMPPELLAEGRLSKAADVYAFGVLLWEMLTGQRPWAGLRHVQIITRKMHAGTQLKWPNTIFLPYKELATQCMHPDSHQRPTFGEALDALEPMRDKAERGQLHVKDAAAADDTSDTPQKKGIGALLGEMRDIEEGEETQHSSTGK